MRLSIFWRLVLSSLAIVALMAAVNLYAILQVHQITALSTQLVSYHYPAIENAQLLITNLYSQFRSQKQYLAVRDAVFLNNFEEEGEQFRQLFVKVLSQEGSAERRSLLEGVLKLYEQHQILFQQNMNRRSRPVSAAGHVRRRERLIDEMTDRLRTYIDLHESQICAVMTEARERSSHAEKITSQLGVGTLLLTLGLAGLTSYSILRPLGRLQEQFRRIGQGNFSGSLDISVPRDLRPLV
jgi:two-component system sensor histidine kinase GlrK